MPSWSIFREEFLGYYRAAYHEEKAMESITRRHRGEAKPAKEYTRELRKIMRFTTLTEEKKLEWVYRKRRVEFKRQLVKKFEALQSQKHTTQNTTPPRNQWRPQEAPQALKASITRSFKMNNRCLKCKVVGHMARGCNNQPRLFCCICGQNCTRTTHNIYVLGNKGI